jgi:hypothetical protein
MNKKAFIISVLAIYLLLLPTLCFAQMTKGNGKLITKSIPISDFTKIEINTFVEINYSQGSNMGNLEFTVDGNLWEYYDIYTKDSVLCVRIKDEYKNKIYPKPTKSLITVSSEALDQISKRGNSIFNFCTAFTSKNLIINATGSGKVCAKKNPVEIENGMISVSGSGTVQLSGTIQQTQIYIRGSGDVQFAGTIQQTRIELSGSGKVHLSGSIHEANIYLRGSGTVKAKDCKINQLRADIGGSGSVEAYVSDTIVANIRGGGNLKYKGNPHITQGILGSGKVKKL